MSVAAATDGESDGEPSRRARFREWRSNRPFAGGVLLMLAGLLIAWVPLQFAFELLLVGGSYTYIGMIWAIGVFLTGAFVLYRPEFSTIFGVLGVVLSILSLLGALGGLLLGLLLGIVGGNLCVAWSPPAGDADRREGPQGGDGTPVRTDGGDGTDAGDTSDDRPATRTEEGS